ncbi:MAG: hypothetical protein LBF77_04555 [Spirochaetaceae bacterium]|jgi:hypothetical protein|nr:hypothetical protein [Spirochaetaceae bacterium]
MVIQKICLGALIAALVFSSCASSPPAESGSGRLDRARSANTAAQGDMDRAFDGSGDSASASGGGAGSSAPRPDITRDKTGKPSWVDRPDSVYDERYYIARVGTGSGRRQAETTAFGNLTGYFGQSVRTDFAAVEAYKQRVANGTVDISSSTDIVEAIQVSSSMESLIGAEIDDVWDDGRTYYAVAVMDKAKVIPIYRSLIDANLSLIDRLTNVPADRRATIETVAAYHTAAGIAGANSIFVTVLYLLGGPDMRSGLKTSADYIYEADNIAKLIPVNVVVENDSEGRIRSAFAGVLSGAGFRTGNNSSRYVVRVRLGISPVDLPNQPNKFSRFVLDAAFTDMNTGAVLFPFNINGREGHISQSEADQRAIRRAEARIKEEYGGVLRDYLSGGLPGN